MKLSIVTTLYKSAPYIEEFHRRSSEAARQLVGEDYEIIMVNDGSPDDSLNVALTFVEMDPHLKVVNLSRNFGHHKAMITGLQYCAGDLVFLLDGDLEEEPEWLLSFAQQLAVEKCDVVYGVQKKRKGAIFERLSGMMFYKCINILCNIKLPKNITTARLMRRKYVKALLLYREREVVFALLCADTGFKQSGMIVTKHSISPTTYTFLKKLNIVTGAITSFSSLPLRIISWIGAIISAGSLLYAFFIAMRILFWGQALDGWTSIMVSIWILGGLIIFFLGIIGTYLANVFSEAKQRPLTIISDVYDGSELNKQITQNDMRAKAV